MLLRFTNFTDLDQRKLMDLYAESNFENTDYFFPDLADKAEAVRKVEAGFLDFLEQKFFQNPGSTYWVLEEDGVWISALRTSPIQSRLFYIEALETGPKYRNKGYGARLLRAVVDALKEEGPFRLCDCVSKKNAASLRTHEKCGFQIVSEAGYDYLSGETDDRDYSLAYCYPADPQ